MTDDRSRQSPSSVPVPNRRVEPYPGDEPCQCGAVTITGHYLTDRTDKGDVSTVHYRVSTGPDCEEMP